MRVTCKKCGVSKERVFRKSSGRTRLYFGDNGKKWHSAKICYDCYPTHKARIVIKNEEDENYDDVPNFHADKRCRQCNDFMELTRYYFCTKCKPVLSETSWLDNFQAHGTV